MFITLLNLKPILKNTSIPILNFKIELQTHIKTRSKKMETLSKTEK